MTQPPQELGENGINDTARCLGWKLNLEIYYIGSEVKISRGYCAQHAQWAVHPA